MGDKKQNGTSVKASNPKDVLEQIGKFLSEKDGKGLKQFILSRQLSDATIFWEVCSEVCPYINKENCVNNTGFFEACEMCLKYIVQEGNPKELLLAILEQCEFSDDDIKFTTLIFFIQKTLLRLSKKRFHSLELALETLTEFLLNKPIPEDNSLENEERKLLAMDEKVISIDVALKAYLQFLKPFVDEVSLHSSKNHQDENIQAQIIILKKNLIKILGCPMLFLDLGLETDDKQNKTNSRICAETVMELLSCLETNLQKMMEFIVDKKPLVVSIDEDFMKTDMELENEENERRLSNQPRKQKNETTAYLKYVDEISQNSICCLAYLIYSEQLSSERIPCVYSNLYLFEFILPFIVDLLKSTKSLLLSKGLKVLNHFVRILPLESIPFTVLDNDNIHEVIKNLIEVMIRCSMKDLRQQAVQNFTSFVKLFSSEGRYQIYHNILNTCQHSGVKGYVINLVKDEIKETLSGDFSSKSFLGPRLHRLIRLALNLPNSETTDLLEHSDRIIAVLNLLRFLIIRDPPHENRSGLWEDLPFMDANFFKPLRMGLDMSKSHYRLELKKLVEGKGKKEKPSTEFDVSVGGASLPALSKNDEISVMHSALNTFDLIDSLLTRLTEIMDQQKSFNKKNINLNN